MLLTLLWMLLPIPCRAQLLPSSPSNFILHRLGNGVQVVLQESHETPLVAIDIWVRAGTADESEETSGIAHLLEHMIFKGTAKHPRGTLDATIEGMGALLNATTERDWAHFYTTLPAPYWEEAFLLIAEHLLEPAIDSTELERERAIILRDEGVRAESDPLKRMTYRLWEEAFPDHPYGLPLLGRKASLQRISQEQVLGFHRQHYRGENLMVVLVGDFSEKRALEVVRQAFGKNGGVGERESGGPGDKEIRRQGDKGTIRNPQSAIRNPNTQHPTPNTYNEPSPIGRGVLGIAFPAPGSDRKEDVYALDVLHSLLSDPVLNWLGKQLSQQQVVQSKVEYLTRRQPGLFTLIFETDQPQAVEEQVKKAIGALRSSPLPVQEIEGAKSRLVGSTLFGLETFAGRAYHFGFYTALGAPDMAKEYLERIQKVTPQEVQRVAQTYLDWEKSIAIRWTPSDRGGEREGGSISKEEGGRRKEEKVQSPKSKVEKLQTANLIPHPSSLKPHPSNDIQKRILENGLKILVLREPSARVVSIQAFILAGVAEEADFTPGVGAVLMRMLYTTTQSETRRSLARKIAEAGGNLTTYWDANFTRVEITSVPERLPLALSLLAEGLLRAEFEPEEFEQARKATLQEVTAQGRTPFQVAYVLVRQTLYPAHPYYQPFGGTPETIARLSLKEVEHFYRRFYIPQNMVIVVAGNVPVNDTVERVRRLFQLEESPTAPRVPVPPAPPRTTGSERMQKMPLPGVHLILGYPLPGVESEDYPALRVLSALLGEGKASRIFQNLRELSGIGYELGALLMPLRGSMPLLAFIRFNPQGEEIQLAPVRDQLRKQIESLTQNPPGEAELERARRFLTGQYLLAHQRVRDRAYWLGFWEAVGCGYQTDFELPELFQKVRAEQVQELARHYLVHPAIGVVLEDR